MQKIKILPFSKALVASLEGNEVKGLEKRRRSKWKK